jgi:hypothetical protein
MYVMQKISLLLGVVTFPHHHPTIDLTEPLYAAPTGRSLSNPAPTWFPAAAAALLPSSGPQPLCLWDKHWPWVTKTYVHQQKTPVAFCFRGSITLTML